MYFNLEFIRQDLHGNFREKYFHDLYIVQHQDLITILLHF